MTITITVLIPTTDYDSHLLNYLDMQTGNIEFFMASGRWTVFSHELIKNPKQHQRKYTIRSEKKAARFARDMQ